jgi:hypothetical protein
MLDGIATLPRARWWQIALSVVLPFALWAQPVRDAEQGLFRGDNYALKAWAYPAIDYYPLVVGAGLLVFALRGVRGQVFWSVAYVLVMAFMGFWYILWWECGTGNCL